MWAEIIQHMFYKKIKQSTKHKERSISKKNITACLRQVVERSRKDECRFCTDDLVASSSLETQGHILENRRAPYDDSRLQRLSASCTYKTHTYTYHIYWFGHI